MQDQITAVGLLDECPMPGCHGELKPHCLISTCDLVRCKKCQATGTLIGEYWPKRAQTFDELATVADELRADVEGKS
jgi:hypothetical protein